MTFHVNKNGTKEMFEKIILSNSKFEVWKGDGNNEMNDLIEDIQIIN